MVPILFFKTLIVITLIQLFPRPVTAPQLSNHLLLPGCPAVARSKLEQAEELPRRLKPKSWRRLVAGGYSSPCRAGLLRSPQVLAVVQGLPACYQRVLKPTE